MFRLPSSLRPLTSAFRRHAPSISAVMSAGCGAVPGQVERWKNRPAVNNVVVMQADGDPGVRIEEHDGAVVFPGCRSPERCRQPLHFEEALVPLDARFEVGDCQGDVVKALDRWSWRRHRAHWIPSVRPRGVSAGGRVSALTVPVASRRSKQ